MLAVPASESLPPGPFRVLERFHLAIAIVTIAAATVFLLALTIMLVDERRETVGVLRLIGLPARRILTQILIEGVVVASGGALFGLVLALLVPGTHQSVLSVALRHGARVRAHHSVGCRHLRLDRRAVGCICDRVRIVGAVAPQWIAPGASMNALAFAWRSLVRQPARSTLAVLGVAAAGALLFDMLLLSHGLIVSMRDLLERRGYDIRVTSTTALPRSGPLVADATATVRALAALPGVQGTVAIRFADAVFQRRSG